MSLDSDKVEGMMADLGCVGDRVTQASIKSRIIEVDYQTIILAGQKFMFCGIKMDNGYVVVGKPSACIDPANWREEIGEKVSFDNTFSEIWALEAYRKRSERKE